MKHSVGPFLGVAVASTPLSLSPRAAAPAHATAPEILLNSSTVQVVHNTPAGRGETSFGASQGTRQR
jgi:hypothetical protein